MQPGNCCRLLVLEVLLLLFCQAPSGSCRLCAAPRVIEGLLEANCNIAAAAGGSEHCPVLVSSAVLLSVLNQSLHRCNY